LGILKPEKFLTGWISLEEDPAQWSLLQDYIYTIHRHGFPFSGEKNYSNYWKKI